MGECSGRVNLRRDWAVEYFIIPKHKMFHALPAQLKPFPVKPVLQVQLNEPAVFWQTALTSHTGTEALHSSMSEIEYRYTVV